MAVEKWESAGLADFQARWESPFCGLFHGAAFPQPIRPLASLNGEKKAFSFSPRWSAIAGRAQNEIATNIETNNAAEERKSEQQLIGFRAVYVFDRLSRDLRPSLCALDGCRGVDVLLDSSIHASIQAWARDRCRFQLSE